jgi:hypothetical protein
LDTSPASAGTEVSGKRGLRFLLKIPFLGDAVFLVIFAGSRGSP